MSLKELETCFKFFWQLSNKETCLSSLSTLDFSSLFSCSKMVYWFLMVWRLTRSFWRVPNWFYKVAAISWSLSFCFLKTSACWALDSRTFIWAWFWFNYSVNSVTVSCNWLLSPLNLSARIALFLKELMVWFIIPTCSVRDLIVSFNSSFSLLVLAWVSLEIASLSLSLSSSIMF